MTYEHFKIVNCILQIKIKKNLFHWLDNILTSKFGDRSIHSKIKHNKVKLMIQNVVFDMLYL